MQNILSIGKVLIGILGLILAAAIIKQSEEGWWLVLVPIICLPLIILGLFGFLNLIKRPANVKVQVVFELLFYAYLLFGLIVHIGGILLNNSPGEFIKVMAKSYKADGLSLVHHFIVFPILFADLILFHKQFKSRRDK